MSFTQRKLLDKKQVFLLLLFSSSEVAVGTVCGVSLSFLCMEGTATMMGYYHVPCRQRFWNLFSVTALDVSAG